MVKILSLYISICRRFPSSSTTVSFCMIDDALWKTWKSGRYYIFVGPGVAAAAHCLSRCDAFGMHNHCCCICSCCCYLILLKKFKFNKSAYITLLKFFTLVYSFVIKHLMFSTSRRVGDELFYRFFSILFIGLSILFTGFYINFD